MERQNNKQISGLSWLKYKQLHIFSLAWMFLLSCQIFEHNRVDKKKVQLPWIPTLPIWSGDSRYQGSPPDLPLKQNISRWYKKISLYTIKISRYHKHLLRSNCTPLSSRLSGLIIFSQCVQHFNLDSFFYLRRHSNVVYLYL